jgi:3-deoxy-7-phosphoheptulonate synthase
MGTNIKKYLPTLIDTIEKQNLNVIWICDPMHGNGKNINGIKTRYFEDIMSEINHFFDIHHQKGTIPGGIHLEMTSNDVTECIGGKYILDNKNFLEKKYLSSCDPRLNFFQTIELIQHVSKIII